MVGGVLDFSKNERTNERTGRMKKEKEGERRQWYLNVQIVARGNDASFGASDFRHRAWSDRDRRRHLQKVFLVVVFEEQSLSLSLSPIGMKRGGGAQKRVLFFKKYNPKLLSARKKKGRETLEKEKDIITFTTTAKNFGTVSSQSNDAKGG